MVRIIAFYLPQFHPISENDKWWGKGFTEWTNTAKAKPMFLGHYQPHIPADLGFYDLRVPETRIAQAEMAREAGIEAFCYYHYWFSGVRLLERPFNEVLESGAPSFPFCLCWANQTWTGIWHGAKDRILIEQCYPGYDDHRKHFDSLIRAFRDPRYLTIEGRPVFILYKPSEIPEVDKVIEFWQKLAKESGFLGLYFIGMCWNSEFIPQEHGFDASITNRLPPLREWYSMRNPINWLIWRYNKIRKKPTVYRYKNVIKKLIIKVNNKMRDYPCVFPNWDNTPRSKENGLVFHNSTPELFRLHLRKALQTISDLPSEYRIIFIKSWNEWAEGNHLEPDMRYGKGYLNVLKEEINKR